MGSMDQKARGYAVLAAIVSVCACIGAVAAPVLYVSEIKSVNQVQDEKINTLKDNYKAIDEKLEKILDRMTDAKI